MPKEFHIGDIISVACEPVRLVCPTGIQGVHDLLNYMTGEDLFTHQLPRVARECRPVLQDEMPWLKEIDTSVVTPENGRSWLGDQVEKFGETHLVYPLHPEDHEVIDPMEEAKKMRPQGGVIKIDLDEPEDPNGSQTDSFSLN